MAGTVAYALGGVFPIRLQAVVVAVGYQESGAQAYRIVRGICPEFRAGALVAGLYHYTVII